MITARIACTPLDKFANCIAVYIRAAIPSIVSNPPNNLLIFITFFLMILSDSIQILKRDNN
jgi:hypothetical protein